MLMMAHHAEMAIPFMELLLATTSTYTIPYSKRRLSVAPIVKTTGQQQPGRPVQRQ